ncbi:MAG: flagellar hook-length control protein FliK [Desulfobacterales bacterium]|nr:flagellar hook-length control protein FliK [Desulfobacterales bacterium]
MNINCMDINSSFLEMLGFKNSSEMMTGLSDFSKGEVLFKDQFASILQGKQFKNDDLKGSNTIVDKLISFVSKELKGSKGTDFLKKLKQFFMMISGNDLTSLTMGGQGLDVLKELLASAGFGIDQINELIDDLKLTMSQEGKNISIDELMGKISELDWEPNDSDGIQDQVNEQEIMLPISAIAFIESIMISLGMPEDVRNSILSDVKTEKGIDLNILIKNFKEFEKQSFASQTFFKTDANNDNVAKLMNLINLGNTSKAFADGKLSLQDFINILETKRKDVLGIENKKEGGLKNILAATMEPKGKDTLFADPIRTINPKADPINTLTMANLTSADTRGEEEISNLVNKLFKNISKQETNNEKIVNVPLNKFSNKDFEKLFPFSFKAENGKDVQTTIKSELEEKFTRLLGKLESNMNSNNDSESKNLFQKGKQQVNGLKLPDSTQSATGEEKLLSSVRYLSSSKKGQVRTLPSYVTNQIGRSIVRAVNQGQNQIQIQLKPPELGRMMITIQDLGNGVKVSVVAENQAARDILMSNSNNLKDALASSGISLENFDVEMGTNFNQSMRDAKNQAGYSKNKKGFGNEVGDGENMKIRNKDFLREQHLTHDGILYYVA